MLGKVRSERGADARICLNTLRASRTPKCIRQQGTGQISYVNFSVKIGHYKSAQTVEKYIMLCI
ncbi:Uncharacterised protein [Yersinia enterocolitica]|nr:Uncharacterised protein [Yersinia enterocolitica]